MADLGTEIVKVHFANDSDGSPLHLISERELLDLKAIRDASVAHVNAARPGNVNFGKTFWALYNILKEKYG